MKRMNKQVSGEEVKKKKIKMYNTLETSLYRQ